MTMTYAEAIAYLSRDPKSVEAEACRALLSRISDLESERDDSVATRDMAEGEPAFSPAAVRELLKAVETWNETRNSIHATIAQTQDAEWAMVAATHALRKSEGNP